ncbi:PadR family transcriptional regulator [Actinoplanes sp. OR16]|uniref:PadR family transcriptional regulator n=1 Tax=Actinoplanes sp. OR16 TaxID=946334 RepID=UPI00135F1B2C|nr:PadR family transcriptional regulator [Actinoplanes sp. OR16]
MSAEPRMSLASRAVLAVLQDPDAEHFGLRIAKATGLPTGSVYPILVRLQQAGWLEREWEDIDPAVEQRPARCFYRLTVKGRQRAEAVLAERPVLPAWGVVRGEVVT